MPRSLVRRFVLSALLATWAAGSVPALLAQTPAQTPRGQNGASQPAVRPGGLDERRADQLRDELRDLMRSYPPALGRVLRLDPGLMTNDGYLAAYPALAAFLAANPQVPRSADYFLSFVNENGWSEPLAPELQLQRDATRDAISLQRNFMQNLTIAAVVGTIAFAVVWLVRLFISHRRWLRATRVQSELNNRLLERMGSNEQLLAYLQSQPGQQLMMPPAVVEPAAPAVAAPFSRILWAVQAGIVLMSGGAGFLVIRHYVIEEAGEALLTVGVLAISVGMGFALASLASYLLSQRFGLLDTPRDTQADSGRV